MSRQRRWLAASGASDPARNGGEASRDHRDYNSQREADARARGSVASAIRCRKSCEPHWAQVVFGAQALLRRALLPLTPDSGLIRRAGLCAAARAQSAGAAC